MMIYHTKIIESSVNEPHGSNNDFIHTKTTSPEKDLDSSYYSVEDLLNIETFITQADNDNDAGQFNEIADANTNQVINDFGTESSSAPLVSKVDHSASNQEIDTLDYKHIDTQADGNTNSQVNGLIIIIADPEKLTFISNIAFRPNEENGIITPVENDAEGKCKEVINTNAIISNGNSPINRNESLNSKINLASNENNLIAQVENRIDDQNNESIDAASNSPDINSSMNLNESFISEVALALSKEDLIEKTQKIDGQPDGFINVDDNSTDINSPINFNESFISEVVLALNKEDLEAKTQSKIEDQCNESITNADVNIPDINFNEFLFSEDVAFAPIDKEFIAQVENQIDRQLDGSTNANANPSDINSSFSSNASKKEESIVRDENKTDGQYNENIDNHANLVEINSYNTIDFTTSTPTEVIKSKSDIPKIDVADSTETLRSQKELKSFTPYIKIYCTMCGDSPWNVRYKTNPNCLSCATQTFLRCSKCNKEYTKHTSIIDHLRYRCIPDNTFYQCSECDYNTRVKSSFKKHVIKHKPTENVECPNCGKSYKNKRSLREHIQYHCPNGLKDQNVNCPDCGKGYRNERFLQLHKRHHCRNERLSEQKFKCLNCDRQYKNVKGLREHQRYYCQNGENVQNIKCPNCSKMFHNEMRLRRHQKNFCPNGNEAKKVNCPICGKVYKNEMGLQKHQRYYCNGEIRKVKCPDCSKELSNEMRLQKHRKLLHSAL